MNAFAGVSSPTIEGRIILTAVNNTAAGFDAARKQLDEFAKEAAKVQTEFNTQRREATKAHRQQTKEAKSIVNTTTEMFTKIAAAVGTAFAAISITVEHFESISREVATRTAAREIMLQANSKITNAAVVEVARRIAEQRHLPSTAAAADSIAKLSSRPGMDLFQGARQYQTLLNAAAMTNEQGTTADTLVEEIETAVRSKRPVTITKMLSRVFKNYYGPGGYGNLEADTKYFSDLLLRDPTAAQQELVRRLQVLEANVPGMSTAHERLNKPSELHNDILRAEAKRNEQRAEAQKTFDEEWEKAHLAILEALNALPEPLRNMGDLAWEFGKVVAEAITAVLTFTAGFRAWKVLKRAAAGGIGADAAAAGTTAENLVAGGGKATTAALKTAEKAGLFRRALRFGGKLLPPALMAWDIGSILTSENPMLSVFGGEEGPADYAANQQRSEWLEAMRQGEDRRTRQRPLTATERYAIDNPLTDWNGDPLPFYRGGPRPKRRRRGEVEGVTIGGHDDPYGAALTPVPPPAALIGREVNGGVSIEAGAGSETYNSNLSYFAASVANAARTARDFDGALRSATITLRGMRGMRGRGGRGGGGGGPGAGGVYGTAGVGAPGGALGMSGGIGMSGSQFTGGGGGFGPYGAPGSEWRGGGGAIGGGGASVTPGQEGVLLDAIARAEGTYEGGYDTVLGNGRFGTPPKPLTQMTLSEVYDWGQKVLRPNSGMNSSAAGRYQFVGGTMLDRARDLGLDPTTTLYSPKVQDMLAIKNAEVQGLGAWEGFKRNAQQLGIARGAMGGGNAVAMPGNVAPNQSNRPSRYTGHISMDGVEYEYGSGGGRTSKGSGVMGTFPITPEANGPVIRRLGGFTLNNNEIYDPKLGVMRGGIALHSGSSSEIDRLYSAGCFAVAKDQWPAFKRSLMNRINQFGPQQLTINPDGSASINTVGEAPRAAVQRSPPADVTKQPKAGAGASGGPPSVAATGPAGQQSAAPPHSVGKAVKPHPSLPLHSGQPLITARLPRARNGYTGQPPIPTPHGGTAGGTTALSGKAVRSAALLEDRATRERAGASVALLEDRATRERAVFGGNLPRPRPDVASAMAYGGGGDITNVTGNKDRGYSAAGRGGIISGGGLGMFSRFMGGGGGLPGQMGSIVQQLMGGGGVGMDDAMGLLPRQIRNPLSAIMSQNTLQLGRGAVDINLKLDKQLAASGPAGIFHASNFDLGVNVDRTGHPFSRPGDPAFPPPPSYS